MPTQRDLTRYFPATLLDSAYEMSDEVSVRVTEDPTRPILTEAHSRRMVAWMSNPRIGMADRWVMPTMVRALGLFMKESPVIIRPSAELAGAMADTEIRVPVAEYRQPFPVMGVELPPSITGPFYPCISLVWRLDARMVLIFTFDRRTEVTYDARIGNDLPTIEDRLARAEGADTDEERRLIHLGNRAAVNLCLLASHRQTRIEEYDPAVARRRQRADPRVAALAAREVRELTFRDLILRDRPAPDPAGGEHGQHQRRHVRRGHWKNVPHGPRHSLRRYQWIDSYAAGGGDEELPTVILS